MQPAVPEEKPAMTKPVGVGIIGAGYWGKKLVQEYLASERNKHYVKLLKICDISLAPLLECEAKFSVNYKQLTQKVENIMEDPKISAIHISAPNHTHYPLAKMALEAGKDVLVEKPISLSSRQAYELVDLASSRERVLHVGHIYRFNSALHAAGQALETGAIGKVFYVRVQWTDQAFFPDRDIIFDLGAHPVDILNQLLQAWPTQVSGLGRAYRSFKDQEEVAYVIAEFQGGVFAHIELSWLHPTKVREVTIVGSQGTLVVDCLNQRAVRYSQGNIDDLPILANNTIESEIDWFIDSVRHRSHSIESGLIGARTVEVLEKIRGCVWERPLPTGLPSEPDHTSAMISVLERARSEPNQIGVPNGYETNGARVGRYVGMLQRLGLLRSVTTPEGVSYEITESGIQFLKEYQRMAHRLGKDVNEPTSPGAS